MTPEGRVKKIVKLILEPYKTCGLKDYWPVPSGYGETSLDVLGCFRGLHFVIETKAEGEKPTPRQQIALDDYRKAGSKVFVIVGETDIQLAHLKSWLENIKENVKYDPDLTSAPAPRRAV